jgi:hypothetical protein
VWVSVCKRERVVFFGGGRCRGGEIDVKGGGKEKLEKLRRVMIWERTFEQVSDKVKSLTKSSVSAQSCIILEIFTIPTLT